MPKEKIAESGDYNLSLDRYSLGANAGTTIYPKVKLSEVVELNPSKQEVASLPEGTEISFVPMSDINENNISFKPKEVRPIKEVFKGYTYFRDGDVLVAKVTPCFENGKAGIARELKNKVAFGSSEFYVMRPDLKKILPEYIYYIVASDRFREAGKPQMTGTGGLQRVPKAFVQNYEIPLPSLSVQEELVAELERYQRIIDGARQIVSNYKPEIEIDPKWEMRKVGEVADVQLGKMLDKTKHTKGKLFSYVRNVSVRWGEIDTHDLPKMYFEEDELERFGLKAGDVLVCEGGEPGRAAVWDGRLADLKYQKAVHRVRFKVPYEPSLIIYYLQHLSESGQLRGLLSGTTIKHLTLDSFRKLIVPVPPVEEQKSIVTRLALERASIDSAKTLITLYESKIRRKIGEVWGTSEP